MTAALAVALPQGFCWLIAVHCRDFLPRLLQVLSELLERQRAAGREYSRILYVGDGRGDYCPSALLLHGSETAGAPLGSSSNRVFAREQYPDGLPCSLWVMLRNEAGSSSAASKGSPAEGPAEAAAAAAAAEARPPRVVPWSSPEQLAALLVRELQLD